MDDQKEIVFEFDTDALTEPADSSYTLAVRSAQRGIDRPQQKRLRDANALEGLTNDARFERFDINGCVNRTIEHRAGELDVHLIGDDRMWIAGEDAIVGQADHHRYAPRIRDEEPIERRLLVLAKLVVAGHSPVQIRLGCE